MNIRRNIVFSLENRKQNGAPIIDNVPIRMRVTYARHRIEFTTGYRIDVSKWDTEKQRVKNGCSNKLRQAAAEINADLNDYSNTVQSIFKEFEVQNTIPSPEELKRAFSARYGDKEDGPDTVTFFDAFDEFVREEGKHNSWTTATYTMFGVVKRHLNDFNANLSFNLLDETGLSHYVDYMRDVRQMRNNTIGKQVGFVKWFLRWALKKGYASDGSFDKFRPKLKTTQKKIIFLTWAELVRLREFAIPTKYQYLEKVRDVFLFTWLHGASVFGRSQLTAGRRF
jgi:hypothetical protein